MKKRLSIDSGEHISLNHPTEGNLEKNLKLSLWKVFLKILKGVFIWQVKRA